MTSRCQRENPLRVLHGEEEYQSAIAMLDRLSDRGNGRTSDETVEALARFFKVSAAVFLDV